MTALDEAPERRWRRTVDRRNRPAKLKVDRLLSDFGYDELDAEVGDAIEARLAGVALAVAPSLRDAVAGEVVTIYASGSATAEEGATAAEPAAVDPVAAEVPAVASDVAQMASYLKQQVLDARAEAERLRTELDRRIVARMDAERENEAIIAEQAAALEAQSRQLAELRAALDSTRHALAETRDEIRRAVGELQALPEPVPADVEANLLSADDAAADGEDEFGLDGEEWDEEREQAGTAALVAEPLLDESPHDDAEERAPSGSDSPGAPGDDGGEAGLTVVEPAPELEPRAEHRDAPVVDRDEPAPGTDAAPAAEVLDPAFDLDEPGLGVKDQPPEAPEPVFDLDEPALGVTAERPDPAFDLDEPQPRADQAPAAAAAFDLDEPAAGLRQEAPEGGAQPVGEAGELAAEGGGLALPADEFAVEPPPPAAEPPAPDGAGDRQPEDPPEPRDPEGRLHAASGPEAPVTVSPAHPEPSDDLDAPLPPASDWLPAALRPAPDAGEPASEPPPFGAGAPASEPLPFGAGEPADELTDFDDFLYDDEELYDPRAPERAAGGDALLESEIEAHWPNEPAAALPPPPPAPPSPFADEHAPEPPAAAERATLGRTLRGRGRRGGGRGRGRWEGSCSICGRHPQVNRRKDLQAAGWDLDDDAATCPQCRGVG